MSIKYSISDRIVYREVDEGIVLIDLDSGFYYSFNGTAGFIFNLLKKDKGTVEVIDELKTEFNISEDEARGDLEQFIETLEQEKIVSRLS